MAEFFNQHGIAAASITSESLDRDDKITAFQRNEIIVVFTVDLFNEGIDFPNVRVLMFLRPTESKTVFMQQLGRGLRLCIGKDRVRILDFIGNYKRANQVRKWLATSTREIARNEGRERRKKTEEAARHRCPFLLNVLESCGVIEQDRRIVTMKKFLITANMVRSHRRESIEEAEARAASLHKSWPDNEAAIASADVSILRELFGRDFLTANYHLSEAEYIQLL